MASNDDLHAAISDAVVALAKAAGGDDFSPAGAADLGRAAKDLAEAYAWMVVPASGH